MKKNFLFALLVLAVSAPAMAGSYKSAGCGLGSMIIKDEGFVQVFAATTNGTFYSQTFGISSGTSNCAGSGGYATNDAQKEMYVTSNYDTISQEMAQGSGEHLNALASLMGCDQGASAQFAAVMKRNYRSIAGSADKMLENVKSTVSTDPALSKSCNG